MEEILLGEYYDQPVLRVTLPAGLCKFLVRPGFYDHDVRGMSWPDGGVSINLRSLFNQSALEEITFGPSFDQPIHEVAWPAGLRRLTFGFRFSQRTDQVVWSPALEKSSRWAGGVYTQMKTE